MMKKAATVWSKETGIDRMRILPKPISDSPLKAITDFQ
jgi:hypothetical protein